MQNYQKQLKNIIKLGIYFVLLVPVLVSSEYLFPFVHLKNLVFRILILVLGVLTAWLLVDRGYINGKKNYVLYSLFALFLVSVLASLFGVNVDRSIWSNYERMDGLINIGFVLVYFFIIIQVFETKEEWLGLLRSSVVGAVLVAFNGFLQIMGVDNSWVIDNGDVRITATIGNAAFFAAYMMFNLFFVVILWYVEKISWKKILYIVLGLFFLAMIYYSSTRGPVVGLVVSLFVMGGLFWNRASSKQKKIIAVIGVLIILFGGLLYTQKDSDWIKNFNAFDRIANISLQDATTINRLLVWKLSWQSFQDRPLLGYGLENYKYGFDKYYNPDISERWFDRAHNVVFDYLNSSGVFGLLSYFAVLGFAIFYLWKTRKEEYFFSIVFIGLLVAYFVQNLFVFDTLNTYLPLILVFGLSGFLYFNTLSNSVDDCSVRWSVPKYIRLWKPVIVIGLAILALMFNFYAVINPAQANLVAINAYTNTGKNPVQALEIFKQAINKDTYGNREIVIQLHNFADRVLKSSNEPLAFKKELFEYTNEQMLSILNNDSHDTQFRLMLAGLYQTYSSIDKSYIKKSIELIKPAFDDSPDRLQLYYVLAQGYILDNEVDKAIEVLQRALAVTDNARSNYANLINAYSLAKNKEKVLEYSQEYIDKFDLSIKDKRNLVKFYYTAGLYEKAADLLVGEVFMAEPDNATNYDLLVAIFSSMREYDAGIGLLNQLIDMYPNWQQAIEVYIKQLEQAKEQQ